MEPIPISASSPLPALERISGRLSVKERVSPSAVAKSYPSGSSGSPSPTMKRAAARIEELRSLNAATASDMQLQTSENARLRELLARERRDRIHRLAEARRAAHGDSSKSPIRSVSPPPPVSAAPTSAATATSHRTANRVNISRAPLPPAAAYHPLIHGAVLLQKERSCERRWEVFHSEEASCRASIVAEEYRNYLIIHGVLRRLRKAESSRDAMRNLLERHRTAQRHLMADENQKRLQLIVSHARTFIHVVVVPFCEGVLGITALQEQRIRKDLWMAHTREWKLRHSAEATLTARADTARAALWASWAEGRHTIATEAQQELMRLRERLVSDEADVAQARWNAYTNRVDDFRKKRSDALEAEISDERRKRQQRQKEIDMRHAEVHRLHHAWLEMEKIRGRLCRCEQEIWLLIMRTFRLQAANVRGREKLSRVEGYFHAALHELPALSVATNLYVPVASAYPHQLCPNTAQLNPPLVPGKSRKGIATPHCHGPPLRRDTEPLPKYLRSVIDDETHPLFVGSFLPHGGMLLDPGAEFTVDMGETWGARLLVCWTYAQEESDKISHTMAKRLILGIQNVDRVVAMLKAGEETKSHAIRRSVSRMPRSTTDRNASTTPFAPSYNTDPVHLEKSSLLETLSRDISTSVSEWIATLLASMKEELKVLASSFPKLTAIIPPIEDVSNGAANPLTPLSPPLGASLTDPAANSDAALASKVVKRTSVSFAAPETMFTAAGSLLCEGGTPQTTGDLVGTINDSFVLQMHEVQQLRADLASLKECKERLVDVTLTLRPDAVRGAFFEDGAAHCPVVTIDLSELRALEMLHPNVHVTVSRRGPSPDDGGEMDGVFTPKRQRARGPSIFAPWTLDDAAATDAASDASDSIHTSGNFVDVVASQRKPYLEIRVSPRSGDDGSSLYISHSAVTDILRMVRVSFEDDINSWAIPPSGVTCSVQVFIRGSLLVVPPSTTFHDLSSLSELRTMTEFQGLTELHQGNGELHFFIIPPQVHGVATEREARSGRIPTYDCRTGAPVPLLQGLTLKLCARLERVEETSILLSPQLQPHQSPKSVAMSPPQITARASSPTSANDSPASFSLNRRSSVQSREVDVPQAYFKFVPRSAVSLAKPRVHRKSTIALQDSQLLTETEPRGLEVTFATFDGICIEDQFEMAPDLLKGLVWSPQSGELTLDGKRIGTTTTELCSFRIAFFSAVRLTIVESVCRCVVLRCGQYTSKPGIRVVQVVVVRPYDKAASSPAKWIPPSSCYVAVDIVASDAEPTFTTAERVTYRGSLAAPSGAASGKGNSASAAAMAAQASSIASAMRSAPRVAIAAQAVIHDPDTQFFCGGQLLVRIVNAEPDDFLGLDIKEFQPNVAVDGLRMEFVESLAAASFITPVAGEAMQRFCERADNPTEARLSGRGPKGEEDVAHTILRFHGTPIGIVQVRFSATNPATGVPAAAASSASAKGGAAGGRGATIARRKSVLWKAVPASVDGEPALDEVGLTKKRSDEVDAEVAVGSQQPEADPSAEPTVQRPAGSLIAEPTSARGKMSSNTNASTEAARGVTGVQEMLVTFDNRVPFSSVQALCRSVVYYRTSLVVPTGETVVDFTVSLGPTVECFDVHGDAITSQNVEPPAPMVRRVIVERSPPLLVSLEKDKVIVYPENSGPKKLYGKFAPFPRDASVFEGGYIRVEIAPDDLEQDDELIVDASLERLRRVYIRLDTLEPCFPETFASIRRTMTASSPQSTGMEMGSNSDLGGAQAVPALPSNRTDDILLDAKERNTRERRKSFQLLETTQRDAHVHAGPPVPVSNLHRLQLFTKDKARRESLRLVATESEAEAVNPSGEGVVTFQPFDMVGVECLSSAAINDNVVMPPPAAALNAAEGLVSPNKPSLWTRVRQDVNTTSVADKFLKAAGAAPKSSKPSDLYNRVFNLVRQAASSQVQLRRQQELERFGIDDTMLTALMQLQQPRSGASAKASPAATKPCSVTGCGPSWWCDAVAGAGTGPQPPQLCCLADFDDNYLGTLFSRPGYLCVAFDSAPAAQVYRGHTFSIDSNLIVKHILSCIAFRSSSRNPSLLEKRIMLTLCHPVCGQSVLLTKLRIEPADDPLEITLGNTDVALRAGSTEMELYDAAYVQLVRSIRLQHSVPLAMPECAAEIAGLAAKVPAGCYPRFDVMPMFPLWDTALSDPDTFHWDGGRIVVRCSQWSVNGIPTPTQKLPPALVEASRGGISFMSPVQHRAVLQFMRDRGLIVPFAVTPTASSCEEMSASESSMILQGSQPAAFKALHKALWEEGCVSEPARIAVVAQTVEGGTAQLTLRSLTVPENDLPRGTATIGTVQEGSWDGDVLTVALFRDDSNLVLDIEAVRSVLSSLQINRAILLDALQYASGKNPANPIHHVAFTVEVSVSDAASPVVGKVAIRVTLQAPMLSWPSPAASTAHGSPSGSPTAEMPSSLSPPDSGSNTVAAYIKAPTTPNGENVLQNLIIRIGDKDRCGGGFFELVPVEGCIPEADKLTIVFNSNLMSLSADGTVIQSKEGAVGRVFGHGTSYLRVEFVGYPFETGALNPKASNTKGSPTNQKASSVQFTAPDESVAPQTYSALMPRSAAKLRRQCGGKVVGKRFVSVLRSIYFRCDPPPPITNELGVDGSVAIDGPSSPAPSAVCTGARRYRLVVSDGTVDCFGRLEVAQTDIWIRVQEAPPRGR